MVRRERVSLYIELNALMYLGVASIIGGIGWMVRQNFQRIGDGLVIVALSIVAAGCLLYCARRATPYSNDETQSPSIAFDYILYLGAAVLGVLVGYLQVRFPPPAGPPPEVMYLVSSAIAFGLAYRFDNRLVLSLAFTALAGAFGLTLTRWGFFYQRPLIISSLAFAALVAAGGWQLHRAGIKRHFFDTYLHLAALTALVALLAGSIDGDYVLLLIAVSALVAWVGFRRQSAWFVCYGLVFAYIGISIRIVTWMHELTLSMLYILVSGLGVIVTLVVISRTVGREP